MFEQYKKKCYEIIRNYERTDDNAKQVLLLAEKMIELCPERYEGYYFKASVPVVENRGEMYQKVLDMTQQIKNDADCYHTRACCYYYFGNYKEALKNSNLAVSLKPDTAKFYTRRAEIKSYLDDYKGALDDYEKAVSFLEQSEISRFFQLYSPIWTMAFHSKQYEKALKYFNKHLDCSEYKPSYFAFIKQLRDEVSKNPEKYSEENYLEMANAAKNMQQEWLLAYVSLLILVKNPNCSKIFYILALNLYEIEYYKSSFRFIKAALEFEIENAEYNFLYATVLLQLCMTKNNDDYNSFSENDKKDILEKLEKAITLQPENAYYCHRVSKYLTSIQNYEKALYYSNLAIKKDNSASWFYSNRAVIKAHLRDYSGVVDDMETALIIYPDESDTFYEIQNVYNNDSELILEFYDALFEKFVNNEEVLKNILNEKIYYLMSKSDFQSALEECVKYIQAYPDTDSNIYLNLGECTVCNGNPQGSLVYFDKAIELNSQSGACYFWKGYALQLLERIDESIEMYDKAIELDNAFVGESYFNKGALLVIVKSFGKALECFEKARPLVPDCEESIIEAINVCKEHL